MIQIEIEIRREQFNMKAIAVLFIAAIATNLAQCKPMADGDSITFAENDVGSDEIHFQEGNPDLENGEYFQGDIKLEAEQKEILERNDTSDSILGSRTGLLYESMRWPKNKKGEVVVPYLISKDYCELKKWHKMAEKIHRNVFVYERFKSTKTFCISFRHVVDDN